MRWRFLRRLFAALTLIVASLPLVASAQQAEQAREKPRPSTGASKFMDLPRFAFLRDFFNLAQGTVRIVSIISPTCPLCRQGFGEIQELLEAVPGNRLRVFVVMTSQVEGDSREKAAELVNSFQDNRLAYFWDAENASGDRFKAIVESDEPVWDVYFIYDTDAVIDKTPAAPALWMHQHERYDGPTLDGEKLHEKVVELLDRLERRKREARTPETEHSE